MNSGTGVGVGIDLSGLSLAIDAADKKLLALEKTGQRVAKSIGDAFRNDAAAGIRSMATEIASANRAFTGERISKGIRSIGSEAINSATSISSLTERLKATRTSYSDFNSVISKTNHSTAITQLNADILQAQRAYKDLQMQFSHQTIEAGDKTTLASRQAEAQFQMQYIALLKKEKQEILAAQQALQQAKASMAQQSPFQNKIDDLSRTSMKAQRYKDAMAEMRAYYREEEKAAKQAANARIQEERKAAKQITAERKRQERELKENYNKAIRDYNTSYAGATKYSDSAQTLAQDRVAIQRLTAAREKLNRTDANYNRQLNDINNRIKRHSENIRRATGESKNFKKEQESIFGASGRWIKRMALMYGVHQISNFIRKLVEVRGEFELQQRSLQVLLQNKDKADEIWNKTVQLAVKSPFRVKELVTYTKQLAAYRIESDKLYETNKMLADVSAGLGVDMNRLILAYGQVKAASYLRGTELRQFSEAGIPMLEELAKRFTELEGRAVSVGDVFTRISKRMVTFADVDAVFKKITSEGGVFYNMQEKQAETLKGMMSNLADSIDLMFNEIGRQEDSTLKGIVRFLKSMVEHWRILGSVIKVAGITFMTYFGVKVLTKIITGIANIGKAFSANPWGMVLTAIALVVSTIWEAVTAQSAFNAAMSQIDKDVTKDLEESIALYKKLADTINDATSSNQERNKAYENLKSAFDKILPQQYLELEYIQGVSSAYNEATEAMFAYYNTKAIGQKKAKIEEMFSEELYGTDVPDLIAAIKTVIEYQEEDEKRKAILLSAVSGVVNSIVDEVKSGKIEASIDKIYRAISDKLGKYIGSDSPYFVMRTYSITLDKNLGELSETLQEYLERLSYIQGLPTETHEERVISETLTTERGKIDKATEAFKQAAGLYEKYILAVATENKTLEDVRKEITDDIDAILNNAPEEIEAYIPALQTAFQKMKEAADTGMFDFRATLRNIESEMFLDDEGIVDSFEKLMTYNSVRLAHIGEASYDAIINAADATKRALEETGKKIDLTTWEESIISGAREIANKFGKDVNIFADFIPQQGEAIDQLRKEVNGLIERYNDDIKRYKISIKQGLGSLSEEALQTTEAEIKKMESDLPALYALLQFLGEEPKDKKEKDKNPMEDRIRVVKELHKSYKDLEKKISEVEALEGAFAKYKDAFAEAYAGTNLIPENFGEMTATEFLKSFEFTTEKGMTAFFNRLITLAKDAKDRVKVELAKGEFVMETRLELQGVNDEELYREIQDKFNKYELYVELKNLKFDDALAKAMFGIETMGLGELKQAVTDAFMGVEDYNEKFEEAGKTMRETFNGTVNLLNRKIIPAQDLVKKGWQGVGEGFATLYSSKHSILDSEGKTVEILVTPILPDGTVLSSEELESYIDNTLNGAENILEADERKLVIHAAPTIEDDLGGFLSELQRVFYAADMLSKDNQKKLSDYLSKISEMEGKAQIDRLKSYLKYSQIAIGKKAQIKIEEMNKLKDIEEAFNKASEEAKTQEDRDLIEQQRQKAVLGAKNEAKEKESKLEWDEFKSSETFVSLFQDLDKASDTLINHAISKLKEFRDQWQNMPVNEAKEIITKLNELEMKLLNTGKPFEDYRKVAEEIDRAIKKRGIKGNKKTSYIELNRSLASENIGFEEEIKKGNQIIAVLNTINSIATKTKQEDLARVGITEEYVKQLGLGAEVLTNTVKQNQDIIDGEKTRIGLLQDNVSANNRVLNLLKTQATRLKAQEQAYSQIKNLANDLYNAFKDLAEAMEADMEGPAAIFADMGMSMLDTVLNTLMMQVQLKALQAELLLSTTAAQGFGLAMNSALGVIGWIVMGVQLLTSIITAIVQAQDKAIDRQVEALKKDIENIQKKYDKLADSISEIYDTTELRRAKGELVDLYEAEKRAIELAIKARESDSKISDEERDEIEELKNDLAELEDTYSETMDEIFSHATDGILDSVYDAAKEFTDAWYEAFKETGDGLSGLQENFDEMLMNLAKNQAAMQITGHYVDMWKKSLKEKVGEDEEITPEAAREWAEGVKASFPALSEALEQFLGVIHEGLDPTGTLSELQKGIQGITEDTAQVLESLLNSMRFYVADSNSQLKQQTQYMRDIYNTLTDLRTLSSNDGYGFKVVMV